VKLPFANFIKAHHISRAALCAGVVVAAIVFFVAGAGCACCGGRCRWGLTGTLAGAIHDALPGIDLDYDRAAIEWTRDQGRVNLWCWAPGSGTPGPCVISAPKAAIGLGGGAVPARRVRDQRHHPGGVEFSLVRFKDGASGWVTRKTSAMTT